MKLALFLVFCLGFALARVEEWNWRDDMSSHESSHVQDDNEFQSVGREFHYVYNGQMTTGIPGSSKQHSGTRIQALVTFLFRDPTMCVMKLNNIRMGKMNRDLSNPQKIAPFEIFEEMEIEPKSKELLLLPIKFTYNSGVISKLVFDGEDQPWSVNIKRGIMNLMQVQIIQDGRMERTDDALMGEMKGDTEKNENMFYRVMEDTIEGECETVYTITKQPNLKQQKRGSVLNVTKSINFEKCIKRPEIKYNFRFSDPCETCESKYNDQEKFLKSSTVGFYNIIGTRTNFLIDSARVESEYTFVPFSEKSNVIVTYVNQTLVLKKITPVTGRIEEPRQPVPSDSDMVFTLDWDVAKEVFLMEGDASLLQKSKYVNIPNKVELIGNMLQKLVQKMQEFVEDDAPKYLKRLVVLFRCCTKSELERIFTTFYRSNQVSFEEQKKIRDIIPHILALCGSKSCVEQLVEKIHTNEVPTLTAVLAIKDLIHVQTPSKEIINELLKLAESEMCQNNFAMKQATWLTIGSLMNGLCTPKETTNVDKLARETKETTESLCPRQLKQKYVQLLVSNLESTNKWEEQLTYLKTLGNAGLDLSIFELEQIVLNKENRYSTMLRTEAVLAMRQLKDIMPKKVQKVLMPILLNKMEPATLRIACSYMILQTMPERPVLDQIAKMCTSERTVQVASFIHSYMDTLANSTNPCEKKLVTDMQVALRHTRKITSTPLRNSKLYRIPLHSEQHKVGLDLDFASSFSNTSNIPRYLTATLHSNFLGFWNKYLFTFGLVNEGLENVVQRLYKEQNVFRDDVMDEMFSHESSTPLNEYEREMRELFSTMDMHGGKFEDASKEAKAFLYMKFKDQDFGFLPIKQDMIRTLMDESHFSLQEMTSKLRNGLMVNFNKVSMLHDMTYKIPTTMGMPLTVSVTVPAVVSIHGKMQMMPVTERSLKAFKINADLKPSMAAALVVDIECWSPIVNHGLKVVNKVKLFTPINAKMDVNLMAQPKIVRMTVRPPSTRREIFMMETLPVTYTRVWPKFSEPESRIVMSGESSRVKTYNHCIGRKMVGVQMCLRGQVQKTVPNTMQFFPLAGPNKVVVTVEPGDETPEEIVINLSGNFMRNTMNTMRDELNKYQSFEDDMEYSYTSTEKPYRREKMSYTPFDEMPFENVHEHEKMPYSDAETPFMKAKKPYETDEMPYWRSEMPQRKYEREEMAYSGHYFEETDRMYHDEDSTEHLPNKPLTSTLKVEIQARPRRFTFDLMHKYDLVDGVGKMQWKLACSGRHEPFVACYNAESIFQKMGMYSPETSDRNVMTTARLTWGRTCNSENFVTLKSKGVSTPVQRSFESEMPEYTTYDEYSENKMANLMKYHVEVDYHNVPVALKNVTNKLFLWLKNHYFNQVDIDQITARNPVNKIRAMITVDPVMKQCMNVTIKTPIETTVFYDIPVPLFLGTPTTLKRFDGNKWWNTMVHDTEERCTGMDCPYKSQSKRFTPEHTDDYVFFTDKAHSEEKCTGMDCPYKSRPNMPEHVDDYDFPSEKEHTWSTSETKPSKPIMKHKMVERDNEICISMQPIPECPTNFREQKKMEKRVTYTCIYRNDPRVWEIQNKIRHGERIQEVERMKPTMTRTEMVPTKCTPFY